MLELFLCMSWRENLYSINSNRRLVDGKAAFCSSCLLFFWFFCVYSSLYVICVDYSYYAIELCGHNAMQLWTVKLLSCGGLWFYRNT